MLGGAKIIKYFDYYILWLLLDYYFSVIMIYIISSLQANVNKKMDKEKPTR